MEGSDANSGSASTQERLILKRNAHLALRWALQFVNSAAFIASSNNVDLASRCRGQSLRAWMLELPSRARVFYGSSVASATEGMSVVRNS